MRLSSLRDVGRRTLNLQLSHRGFSIERESGYDITYYTDIGSDRSGDNACFRSLCRDSSLQDGAPERQGCMRKRPSQHDLQAGAQGGKSLSHRQWPAGQRQRRHCRYDRKRPWHGSCFRGHQRHRWGDRTTSRRRSPIRRKRLLEIRVCRSHSWLMSARHSPSFGFDRHGRAE